MAAVTLNEQIRANRAKTVLLLFAFLVLFVLLGGIVYLAYAPTVGALIGVGLIAYGIASYVSAGSLTAHMAGAHPVAREEAPELYRAVENAALAAGLSRVPDVYLIRDPAPNAFAAGTSPKRAYVAATTGLLEVMDKRELEAVMAHEIAHVRNEDVRLMSVVTVLIGVLVLLSDILLRMAIFGGRRSQNPFILIAMLAAFLLAPLVGVMLQMAISRRREFLADATAAEITHDPEGMARALARLEADPRVLARTQKATAHLYIESPLDKASGPMAAMRGLFSTHPPIPVRIERLERAGGFQLGALPVARPVRPGVRTPPPPPPVPDGSAIAAGTPPPPPADIGGWLPPREGAPATSSDPLGAGGGAAGAVLTAALATQMAGWLTDAGQMWRTPPPAGAERRAAAEALAVRAGIFAGIVGALAPDQVPVLVAAYLVVAGPLGVLARTDDNAAQSSAWTAFDAACARVAETPAWRDAISRALSAD